MSLNLSNYLNNLKKPEVVQIARAVNEMNTIKGIQKMKKQELIVELIIRDKHTRDVINKDIKPKRTRKTKDVKISNEDANKLIREINELNKKAIQSKKIGEKARLLKEIEKLNKKLMKGL